MTRCLSCGSLKSNVSGCLNCENVNEKYNKICWDHLSDGGRTLLITFNPYRDQNKKESLEKQYRRFSNAMRYLREREPWKG